jgi:opacity protein-like surface antigen
MKQSLKKQILAVALSGALLGTAVMAQDTTTPAQPDAPKQDQTTLTGGHHGGGHHGDERPGFGGFGMEGMRGMHFGSHMALGTKLSFTFYDGDPANGGTELSTLEFTNGTDSESAFAETFQTARDAAKYMVVNISEQTRTVDLSSFAADQRQELRPRELGRPGTLNEGSTLTATFYNGDPENSGTVVTTLSFTQGTSSESGFASDFAAAAETASFVTIKTSPQTQTIDLSATGPQGFGRPN